MAGWNGVFFIFRQNGWRTSSSKVAEATTNFGMCSFRYVSFFFVDYLLKVWLLTLDASAVVICAVSSCEFSPGAHSAWGWGDRLPCQRQDGVVFSVLTMDDHGSMVFQDWSRHLCPEVFCPGICWAPWKNSAITVKSQGAVRSENYRHKLVATWLQQTPVPPGHAESATGALRADNKCQWRNTKKIQKWLARVWARFAPRRVFQGLHRLAQVSWSFQSSCKANVKPMWSPCEAL